MEVTATDMRQCQLVRVEGRVDSSTAPELHARLGGLVQVGQNRLVVNLSDVGFLSSAGLRALLSATQAARRTGGDVRLSTVSDQVARLLEITSFDVYFKCFSSDSEAVASF